ncbi:hypothetical protein, partial [Mycolicibacterium phlei]
AENSASWKADSASTSSPSTLRDASGLFLGERLLAGIARSPLELLTVGASPRDAPRIDPALPSSGLRLVHI